MSNCDCYNCSPDSYGYVFVRVLTDTEKRNVVNFKKRIADISKELEVLRDKENKLKAELIVLTLEQKEMMRELEEKYNFEKGFKIDHQSHIIYELIKKT